jgi:hypothetical protein
MLQKFLDFLVHFRTCFGVYLRGSSLFICKVSIGIKGILIDEAHCLSLEQKSLGEHLREWVIPKEDVLDSRRAAELEPAKAQGSTLVRVLRGCARVFRQMARENLAVGVCLSDTECFCSVFPMQSRLSGVESLVTENPKAAFLLADDLAVDLLGFSLSQSQAVVAAAAKKSRLQTLYRSFDELKLKPVRIEPARWAALRVAWRACPPPQEARIEMRVLFGTEAVLAALTFGDYLLASDFIERAGEDASDIDRLSSIVRRLMNWAASKPKDAALKQVVLHGDGPFLQSCLEPISKVAGLPVRHVQGEPFDGGGVSFGAALGALDPETPAVHFSRAMRKSVSLLSIFPWAQTLAALAVVLFVLLSLAANLLRLQKDLKFVQASNAQDDWALRKGPHEMETINGKILKEANALDEFLGDRVFWTPILEEVGRCLPPQAKINYITLADNLWNKGLGSKALGDRNVSIDATSVSPLGDLQPRHFIDFKQSLVDAPEFGKVFPVANLVSINWRPVKEEGKAYCTARLTFSSDKGAAAPPPAAGKGEK